MKPINLVLFGSGLCLMAVSLCLYRFYDFGVFTALPLFCIGCVLAGASVLIARRGRAGVAWLILGWSLVVLPILLIVLLVMFISKWVGP